MTRKKWQTRYVGMPKSHQSEAAAYRYVNSLRVDWGLGAVNVRHLAMYVDEGDGQGWQLFERVDLGIPTGIDA